MGLFCLLLTQRSFAQQSVSAADSLDRYFLKLSETERFKKENLKEISMRLASLEGPAFQFVLENQAEIEQVLGKNTVKNKISGLILKEKIQPQIWKDTARKIPVNAVPAWETMRKQLQKKYGRSNADMAVLSAKFEFFDKQKDSKNLALAFMENIDRNGLDTSGLNKVFFNNLMFQVMLPNLESPALLLKCANWMRLVIDSNPVMSPDQIDTYANLLYKAKHVKDAMIWEKKAMDLAPDVAAFRETYEKMAKGIRTW
ncbi:hypothetical protein SAMN05216464_108151 [Mucilaginibacter pineti]|uniref:Uncharacterized protein n=2 Tax=Mucilaginibacter pineti TaxID=1391627 RepID=A0A1G7ETQ0_9SPHI|nr:hypothetical protein SAMN05216464_108151 [Mucilaginibacter pineti]